MITRILVLSVAAIGFLFDTYELLMFPVIGSNAISELEYRKGFTSLSAQEQQGVRDWSGRMLWIAALAGGGCGLAGGLLIDRMGRKTIMVASILAYSVSPVLAAYSTDLWMLILFRCTTFAGVCVEMVAAVTWLAELFDDKRTREMVIGWTLATASLGGILVTEAYNAIVEWVRDGYLRSCSFADFSEKFSEAMRQGYFPDIPFMEGHMPENIAWRLTLLTGLIPGALILILMPFVPESGVWKQKKEAGTLQRPSFFALFTPELRMTTIVTTILSACGYAAAFGAIQMTPLQIAPGLPDMVQMIPEPVRDAQAKVRATPEGTPEREAAVKSLGAVRKAHQAELKAADQALQARRGDIQRWQELGGLAGRILLAVLLLFVPSQWLIRLFLIPGVILLPVAYFKLVHEDYVLFATAIFFCGLLTVAQFSFLSEFLPKVFPMHLRGTGGSFATNLGGRMIGTMAATLNTEVLSKMFEGTPPLQVAAAAGVIGGTVYLIALLVSFLLPAPQEEGKESPAPVPAVPSDTAITAEDPFKRRG
jgi:MFS family permease